MSGTTRNLLIYSVIASAVATAALLVYFLGLSFYVITGGSMEDTIPKGALAIERCVPAAELQVGDIITFQPPGSPDNVTHRIIAIDNDGRGNRVYTTKGDANKEADPWHFTLDRPEQAKYVASVPWVGYCLAFFAVRTVRTVLLAGFGVVLIISLFVWFRRASRDLENEWLPENGCRQRRNEG